MTEAILGNGPLHAVPRDSSRARKGQACEENPAFGSLLSQLGGDIVDRALQDDGSIHSDREAEDGAVPAASEEMERIPTCANWVYAAQPLPDALAPVAAIDPSRDGAPEQNPVVPAPSEIITGLNAHNLSAGAAEGDPPPRQFHLKNAVRDTSAGPAVDRFRSDSPFGVRVETTAGEAPGRGETTNNLGSPEPASKGRASERREEIPITPPAATLPTQQDGGAAQQILDRLSSQITIPSKQPAEHRLTVSAGEPPAPGEIKVLRMRLKPEALGEVEVTLRRAGEEMKIHIAVTKEVTAEYLRRDLGVLEDRIGALLALGTPQSVTIEVRAPDQAAGQSDFASQDSGSRGPPTNPGGEAGAGARRSTSGKEEAPSQSKRGGRDGEDPPLGRSAADLVV